MKITKNIKFEEIETVYIDYYNYKEHGDIYYPPYLKELYIYALACEVENLYKLNLPITLEKLYIGVLTTSKQDYTNEYNPEIMEQIKLPFGCVVKDLPLYENPFEDLFYFDININNSKIIMYEPETKNHKIIQCIKDNKKYYIPIMHAKYKCIKLNF
jgi:hypothetical protein